MAPLLTPASAKLATEFYEACGLLPAWMHEGKPTAAGDTLLEVFRKVSLRGLDESGYSVPADPTVAEEAGSTKGLLAAANFELRLTVAAMRLTKDLHCGQLDPHRANADLLPNCVPFNPVKFVWHVAQSRSPAAEFDWLEPPAPGYQRTKWALQHYIPLISKLKLLYSLWANL